MTKRVITTELIDGRRNLHYRNVMFTKCGFKNIDSCTFSACVFDDCQFISHWHTHYYACQFLNCRGENNDTSIIKAGNAYK